MLTYAWMSDISYNDWAKPTAFAEYEAAVLICASPLYGGKSPHAVVNYLLCQLPSGISEMFERQTWNRCRNRIWRNQPNTQLSFEGYRVWQQSPVQFLSLRLIASFSKTGVLTLTLPVVPARYQETGFDDAHEIWVQKKTEAGAVGGSWGCHRP